MITILGLFCPAGEDRNRRQTVLAPVPGARPRKVRPSVEIRVMRYIPLCLILEQTIKCRQQYNIILCRRCIVVGCVLRNSEIQRFRAKVAAFLMGRGATSSAVITALSVWPSVSVESSISSCSSITHQQMFSGRAEACISF
jgi:hypothetical protein